MVTLLLEKYDSLRAKQESIIMVTAVEPVSEQVVLAFPLPAVGPASPSSSIVSCMTANSDWRRCRCMVGRYGANGKVSPFLGPMYSESSAGTERRATTLARGEL